MMVWTKGYEDSQSPIALELLCLSLYLLQEFVPTPGKGSKIQLLPPSGKGWNQTKKKNEFYLYLLRDPSPLSLQY